MRPTRKEGRAMRLVVVEIHAPRVADADQKLPATGLFFRYDPGR
jgi:hypothetical protein